MIVLPIELFYMKIHSCCIAYCIKEFMNHLCIELSHRWNCKVQMIAQTP